MSKKLTLQEFISKAKNIHGDIYDYSLVEYVNSHIKIKIICPKHGVWEQKPNNHLCGKGCCVCGYAFQNKNIFISKAKNIHSDIYDYSLVEYVSSNKKIEIICVKHGKFYQTPNNHLRGQGCPKCKTSKGELKIEEWLQNKNIKYIHQKRFYDCRNKQPLPFDFYLPDHNMCIEFDGEQHFKPYRYKTSSDKFIKKLEKTQLHDKIKNIYCLTNNIKLIRIPYTKQNMIEEILEEQL